MTSARATPTRCSGIKPACRPVYIKVTALYHFRECLYARRQSFQCFCHILLPSSLYGFYRAKIPFFLENAKYPFLFLVSNAENPAPSWGVTFEFGSVKFLTTEYMSVTKELIDQERLLVQTGQLGVRLFLIQPNIFGGFLARLREKHYICRQMLARMLRV